MSEERSSTEATDRWHRDLAHTRKGELAVETTQTTGMSRFEAISGQRSSSEHIWMGESHVAGGISSADHHHGHSETGIYVVSGHPAFVFLKDGVEQRIMTSPGDYVYVPPFAVHREENPGDDNAIVVLARSTQEAIVINVKSLTG